MGLLDAILTKKGTEAPPPAPRPSQYQYGEPKPTPLYEPRLLARVIPTVSSRPMTIEGRTYTPAKGAAQDVPLEDARVLVANEWVLVSRCGTSVDRPELPRRGEFFVETGPRVDRLLQFDGRFWRDPLTGDVA